jgi:hypothetical protein
MSFYPINPDTAVESFLLISSDVQKTNLGPTYNLSQLVPLNYRKVMDEAISQESTITFVPLREFVTITSPIYKPDEITNEFINLYQSSSLLTTFQEIFNYYSEQASKYFFIGAGVITEIKTDLMQDEGNTFFITHKLKVEWFVVPGSQFS